MENVFKNNAGEIGIFDDAELAAYYGFTEKIDTVKVKPVTGVYYVSEKRELSAEECRELEKEFHNFYNELENHSQDEIREWLEKYKFWIHCSYRDGEKTADVLLSVLDDPLEKCADDIDWSDMWECDSGSELYYMLEEIAKLKGLI